MNQPVHGRNTDARLLLARTNQGDSRIEVD
jgi:hypothetical protein